MRTTHRTMVAVALAAVLAATVSACTAAPRGGTSISGTVWHDINGNGVRDANEPGIANVTIVSEGWTQSAVTGTDGSWSLVVPTGSNTLTAITGWLPSDCPGDLYCAAGRTANQRFAVENQFVRAHITVTTAPISGLDLGLLPDHGDPTGAPGSMNSGNDPGDGPALVHDLAARNSVVNWYAGCTDPDYTRVCPVGTTLTATGQIYNQGTAEASGVLFVVALPPGTSLVRDPALDPVTPGVTPTRTGRTGTTAGGGKWIEFALNRTIPPAGAVWFTTSYSITGGPLTPIPYTKVYDHKAYISIVAVDGGDADSTLRYDPRIGLDRGHNVNWPRSLDDDTSDAIEFNVG